MRVLLFGGTAFVGRHVTEALLGRGHQVTLFHRGLTDPDASPDRRQPIAHGRIARCACRRA
jgi:2'-hydroxyisoflavone reductase